MPLYFMIHDAERFHTLIRPAFAASWRQRAFGPCVALREALADEFVRFMEESRVKCEDLLLLQMQPSTRFDFAIWRMLVGEVLLGGAAEVPEIPLSPPILCSLLTGKPIAEGQGPRDQFSWAEQLLFGTKDVTFGGGCYRPGHAGYNDSPDVEQLTDRLVRIDPERWTTAGMALDAETSKEERQEELAYARQGFDLLRAAYARARTCGQLVFCEEIG